MGCYKSKCKLCGKEIKGKNHLFIMINQGEHEEKFHKTRYYKNRKAELEYKKDMQKALDKKLKILKRTFTHTKWDGEDMTDEEARAKGFIE